MDISKKLYSFYELSANTCFAGRSAKSAGNIIPPAFAEEATYRQADNAD